MIAVPDEWAARNDGITVSPIAAVYVAAAKRAPSRLPTDIPVAWAVPHRFRGSDHDVLRVLRCPYCQGQHHHGDAYGTRVSHCHNGDYALCPPRGVCITGTLT